MVTNLVEDRRNELINKSKKSDNYKDQSKGKNRYERRLKSKVLSSVSEFNKIDMNSLFKDGILIVTIKVQGETDTYFVKIKFDDILDNLHKQLKLTNGELNIRVIIRALVSSFNSEDVYVNCNCKDYIYRHSYWNKVNNVSSDPDNEQDNNGRRIVNPNDTKGPGCKHIMIVLSNNSWINRVAAVIFNYINYMEKHYQKMYADIIYPAIYEKEYEDDVQLSMDDSDELVSTEDEIDSSNKYAKDKNKFKKGNQSGIQFASKNNSDEKQFDFDSLS